MRRLSGGLRTEGLCGWRCIHLVDTMLTRVRRWGNGLAVRLRRADLDVEDIEEGDVVRIEIVKVARKGKVDLSSLPTFVDKDRRASVNHDRYLYGASP